MPAPWEQDYHEPPPDAVKAKPWEKDYGSEAKAAANTQEPGLGAAWERMKTWPGRIAETVVSGATLPRDVWQGNVDPNSEEGQRRLSDTASLIMPGSIAARTGAQVARRTFDQGKVNPDFVGQAISPAVTGPRSLTAFGKPLFKGAGEDLPQTMTPGMEAARTASDLGVPLPAGLVSDSKATRALTQASRSMPIVGAKIDERVGNTIEAAGNAVNDIAEGMSGGVPDRATAGAGLRPSLQGIIDDNNGRIDQVYQALRHVIDPDAVTALSRTRVALDSIFKSRIDARMVKPEAGLQDINKLVNNGASFNGLQRARADVGKIIGLAANNPNPGFNAGDFKRLYAAMTGDMEGVVRINAKGVHPNQAAEVWKQAEGAAAQLVDRNKKVQNLLNIKTDEGVVGGIINAAQGKSGNAKLLMQLRQQMPKQDFEQIVGVGLSELGHNPATGKFSLEKFGTGYRNLGATAKSILFPDPAHRKALDGIANLDEVLKASDKYINKSGTGRVDTLTKIIGGGGAVAGALASGNIAAVFAGLVTGAGGFGLAKYLARPATASALAKWMHVARNAPRVPGPARQAMLAMASRNLINNVPDITGPIRNELIKRFANPTQVDTEPEEQKSANRVRPDQNNRQVRGKDQSRAPRVQPAQ